MAPPAPATLLTDQLGALLALACDGKPIREEKSATLRARVEAAIRERHAEPGLTAVTVAMGLGIGERSLHRALAGGDATFAQQLMTYRVKVARRLLADSRYSHLTVAEIGRRVGLLDPSHFVRVYRKRTLQTPAEWRRTCAANGASAARIGQGVGR